MSAPEAVVEPAEVRGAAAPRRRAGRFKVFGPKVRVAAGGVIVAALFVIGALAPWLAPHDPTQQHLQLVLKAPGALAGYPLGTDSLGRDILSRLIFGARVSLLVGGVTVVVAGVVGCLLGAVSGIFGGAVDFWIQKLVELFLSFPFLLLAIAMLAAMGQGLGNLLLVLIVRYWIDYCRIVRAETLALREREYVLAAVSVGAGRSYLVRRHILPNTLASIVVVATFTMALAILGEASLSFLGLGVPPSVPSWGSMLSDGRVYIYADPWLTILPGAAIFVTVLGVNLLGDGLRDVLDPQLKGGVGLGG